MPTYIFTVQVYISTLRLSEFYLRLSLSMSCDTEGGLFKQNLG